MAQRPYFLLFLVRWQNVRIHAESLQLVTQGRVPSPRINRLHLMSQSAQRGRIDKQSWGNIEAQTAYIFQGFLRLVGPHNALLPRP